MANYLDGIVRFIKGAFNRFIDDFNSSDVLQDFFRSKGWITNIQSTDVAAIRNAFSIIPSAQTIIQLIQKLERSQIGIDDAIGQAIPAIKTIYSDIQQLANINISTQTLFPLTEAAFWSEISSTLADDIIVAFIKEKSPVLFAFLHFFGIVRYIRVDPTTQGRIPYYKKQVQWDKIGDLLSDPMGLVKTEYSWGIGPTDYVHLFDVLSRIFDNLNTKVDRGIARKSDIDIFYPSYTGSTPIPSIEIPFIEQYAPEDNQKIKFSISALAALSPSTNQFTGLLLIPNFEGLATFEIPLSPVFLLTGEGYFQSNNFLGYAVYPNDPANLITNPASLLDAFSAKVTLTAAPLYPLVLFGALKTTRLMLSGIEASLEIRGHLTDPEFIFNIGTGANVASPNFLFVFEPGKGDGFINKILGNKNFSVPFSLGISWSSKTGIAFVGSGGFDLEIPLHDDRSSAELTSPLRIDALRLGMHIGNGQFNINAGVSITFQIGPLIGVVRDIGASISLTKKNGSSSKGLFNNLDFELKFKPPSGIGISIDSDSVSGGGFLNYDESTYTYTGGIELKFSKISLHAIGILVTKMPDGSNGYSLLIIITAEFTPIQLGMGFTLNGVGGLLGLNRTMNKDRLQTGIRDNTLDSILFPKDIVKNANTIISNVSQAFPIKKDRFLIGPMAKIGWGTPTLLTIDLGIIIEVPSPVTLAILGVIKAILPSESNPILRLQVNFFGFIDFEKKQLSFDATLYNSSILTFGLQGDMALRLYWGDKPNFLLSIGGFHSKYTPPPMNLPQLKRVGIIFADSDDLSIKLLGFFAITSNTVQFGASIEAHAHADSLEAYGFIGFEVLVQFSPFHFIASMEIDLSLSWKGNEIAGMHIAMSFEGPHPWRVQGRGTVEFWFFSVDFSFDKTFGQPQTETIETIEVKPKLISAIQNKDNWQVIGPDRSHQVVSFRDITTSTGANLVVDPFGALVMSQKAVPLDTKIAKYATSAIKDYNQFSITSVTLTGTSTPLGSVPPPPVKDFFAPESFFYLLAEQKLSRESYEKYNSGVTIGNTDKVNFDYFIHKQLKYEEIIIDMRQRRKLSDYLMQASEQAMHMNASYISRSELSSSGSKTPANGPNRFNVNEDTYTIIDRNTMGQVNTGWNFDSLTQASNYLNTLNTIGSGSPDYIVVNTFEI